VYTDYRPVPLQHFVFPVGAEGLFLVVDEKGKFRDDNFQRAMSFLQSGGTGEGAEASGGVGGDKKQRNKGGAGAKNLNSDLFKIIKLIMERGLDPCIVFSFSKKDCETYALQMARLDFNNEEEKSLVEKVFLNAMDSLSEDDKALPAVQTILPLLKNGVGIHHGGLLPILKEVIELLFQEGLIKCLFATETFSIGINMPAKTVVFTQTRKFDGKDFRWITSGEYIQMSGRAGRRGKDDKGIVIQMLDEKMEPDIAKNMIYGASDPLFSSYHVGYNMVLNMLRVEDADPEKLIRTSFHQFQQERNAPELERQGTELRKEAALIEVPQEDAVREFVGMNELLLLKREEINRISMQPAYCIPFLQSGRMVQIGCDRLEWGWGVVVNMRKSAAAKGNKKAGEDNLIRSAQDAAAGAVPEYIVDVLLEVTAEMSALQEKGAAFDESNVLSLRPRAALEGLVADAAQSGANWRAATMVVHVVLESITALSAVRLNLPKDITTEKTKSSVMKSLQEVRRRFTPPVGTGIPLLDFVTDLAIPADTIQPLLAMRDDLTQRLAQSKYHAMPEKEAALEAYTTKSALLKEADACAAKARESQAVAMREELKKMKRVLRRLEFITSDNVLALKGRFSCELSTADELVATNMVFDGAFNDLAVPQIVALLSCFVHKEENKDAGGNPKIRSDMQAPFRQLQAVARGVAKVCAEAKLIVDEEEYVNSFNPGLVDVAYAWW
jgi:ATP-dependent RNA helicase DOB1